MAAGSLPVPRRIVCDGNSLTFGFAMPAGSSYPAQLQALFYGQNTQVVNLGVNGKSTGELTNDFTAKVGPYAQPGTELVFFEQRNSFALGVSVEAEKALAQAYVAQAKAAGFRVWICSPPPTTDLHAAKIEEYSTWLRSNHGFADGFIDFNARPEFVPAGNVTYYYFDGVHLSAAGYGVLAGSAYGGLS